MRIVITGASGFVGSRLMATLAGSPEDEVRAAGRSTTERAQALAGADALVHCAARVHVMRESESDPLTEFRRVNTAATLELARQAAAAGVRRMVFISSVKVNGESTAAATAFTEGDLPHPADPYAISKLEAEQGLLTIAADTGIEVVIIRPPLVYGPGVKANFASLMRAVARGWPLPLGGLSGNRRSLVALDNLVDFIITCLAHPAAANQGFLISDGEDLSTAELARRLGLALNQPARLVPVPARLLVTGATLLGRSAAAQRLCGNLQVDISKARSLLNWSPPIGVDEGLRRAVAGLSKR